MTIGGVTLVMLGVSDMARSVRFYEGALGRRVLFRVENELTFLDGGTVTIGLNTALAKHRPNIPGATELVLSSQTVKTDFGELAANGIPVVREPRQATQQGEWTATVADPDGHYVTLFGPPGP